MSPLPSITVHGSVAFGSSKFHLDPNCNALKSLKGVPAATSLPLGKVSKTATCASCCAQLRSLAEAYRFTATNVDDKADMMVLMKCTKLDRTPTLLVQNLIDQYPLADPLVSGNGGSLSGLRLVPLWLSRWMSKYATLVDDSADRNRYQTYTVTEPTEKFRDITALWWRIGVLEGSDRKYLQYVVPVVEGLFAQDNFDVERMEAALKLYAESLEVDGPLKSVDQALEAVDLLFA